MGTKVIIKDSEVNGPLDLDNSETKPVTANLLLNIGDAILEKLDQILQAL